MFEARDVCGGEFGGNVYCREWSKKGFNWKESFGLIDSWRKGRVRACFCWGVTIENGTVTGAANQYSRRGLWSLSGGSLREGVGLQIRGGPKTAKVEGPYAGEGSIVFTHVPTFGLGEEKRVHQPRRSRIYTGVRLVWEGGI